MLTVNYPMIRYPQHPHLKYLLTMDTHCRATTGNTKLITYIGKTPCIDAPTKHFCTPPLQHFQQCAYFVYTVRVCRIWLLTDIARIKLMILM